MGRRKEYTKLQLYLKTYQTGIWTLYVTTQSRFSPPALLCSTWADL